jgi:hypothetical protein
MCRPLAFFFALALLFVCPAALGQTKPPPDAETWLDREGEPADPDDLAPALRRSTDRVFARGPIQLSLLAWHQDVLPFARDRGLGVVLTLPLERVLARPLPPLPPPGPAAAPLASMPLEGGVGQTAVPFEPAFGPAATPFEPTLGPAAHTPLPPPTSPEGAPRPTPAAFSSDPMPGQVLAALQISAEQMKTLSNATLRAAGLSGAVDDRLDGLSSRARTSALLPELRLRAVQSNDQALRLSYADTDPYRTQTSGGSALLLEARATFRLDRVLFADDEVTVERLRGDVREQRQRLLIKLAEAVGVWQRAQAALLDPDASPRERASSLAQAIGASTLIDVLSAGAWSRLRARSAGAAPER